MTIKKFPIENIESWFFYNLDITTLPDWYEENSSTAKRLERIAQILTRQGRFNEYVKEDINDLFIKSNTLNEFILSVKQLLEDEVDNINDRIDGVDDEISLLSTAVDTLEDDVNDIKNVNTTQNTRLTTLEGQVLAHTAIIGLLQEDINDNTGEINTVKNNVTSLTSRVNILENDVDQLESSSIEQGNEIDNHEARIAFLEASNNDSDDTVIISDDDFVKELPLETLSKNVGVTTGGKQVIDLYIRVEYDLTGNNQSTTRELVLENVEKFFFLDTYSYNIDTKLANKQGLTASIASDGGEAYTLSIGFNNGADRGLAELIFKVRYTVLLPEPDPEPEEPEEEE